MAQDSSRPDFWDARFRGGVTPWDAGGVPARLAAWLAQAHPPMNVLVPGCGAGYEVRAFAEHGHDVLGIDFSAAALDAARTALGPLARHVRQADFFALSDGPFDLVYERAFLCALPPAWRSRWAERCAELVRPGGLLAGFFYFDDNLRGPPFGIAREALAEMLGPAFELVDEEAVAPEASIPVFQDKERWQQWKRRL